jgi:TRAP-type C4-dicarboxylate transport system permease small subunit
VLNKLVCFLETIGTRAARFVYGISMCMLLMMMLLTVYDVAARYFFSRPVAGAYEFTEFLLVIMVASALAFTQIQGRHISVDLLFFRLGSKGRRITQCTSSVICLATYLLIAWQSVKAGQTQWRHGVISGAFQIPLWPFYIFLAFGCAVLCLVFLAEFLRLLMGKEGTA